MSRALDVTAVADPSANGAGAPLPALGIGLGAFLAQDFPSPTVYIEDTLSDEGGGWLTGEEKLGKTFYALDEALCLAFGLPVAARFTVPECRRVLFVEEEDSPRRTHRRLRALLRGHGYDPDDTIIRETLDRQFQIAPWSGFKLDDPAQVARLVATLTDFAPHVVYLDVFRKMTAQDMKDQAAMSAVLDTLDDLRRRFATMFRVVHHYRKSQGFRTGRGSQEIAGSFVLGAWGENSLFFEPIGRKQGAVRLSVQCKDLPPVPDFTLRIESEGPPHDPTLVRLVAEEIKTESAGAESDELIYQAVATLPKVDAVKGDPGVPIAAVESATKKSNATVRRSLDRLIDAGRCLLTGTMSKQKKLYGISEKKINDIVPAHASIEQP